MNQQLTERLEKFKRRAKMVATPEHLAKILATFPRVHHKAVRKAVAPHLKDGLLKQLDESR